MESVSRIVSRVTDPANTARPSRDSSPGIGMQEIDRSSAFVGHARRHEIVAAVALGLQPLSAAMASIGQAALIGTAAVRLLVDPVFRSRVAATAGRWRHPVVLLGVAMVVWSLLAMLWSPDPAEGLGRLRPLRAIGFAAALVPVLGRPVVPMIGLAVGFAVEAIVQISMYTGIVPDPNYEPWTVSGGLSKHPGNAAVWSGVGAVLLLGGIAGPPFRPGPRRIVLVLGIVLGLTSVLIAGNRSLFLGLPMAVLVLVAWRLRGARPVLRRRVAILLVMLVAGTAALPVIAPDLPPVQRVRSLIGEVAGGLEAADAESADTSGGLRMIWWREGIRILRSAPFIGHGSGSTREAYRERLEELGSDAVPERAFTDNPHSSIVFALVEHGLVGTGLLAGFLIAAAVAGCRRAAADPALAGLPAAWVLLTAYAIGNTIQLSMYPLMLLSALTALSLARPSSAILDSVTNET